MYFRIPVYLLRMKHFEDFEIGDTHDLGSCTVTREEIVEFAEQYDPQPFHVDEEAAAESIYQGLIASGWHTGSLCMRQLATELLNETAGMGARGVDEFRWYAPVRPGDVLSVRGEVVDKSRSETHSDRGYVDYRCTMTNQDGDQVLGMVGLLIVRRQGA